MRDAKTPVTPQRITQLLGNDLIPSVTDPEGTVFAVALPANLSLTPTEDGIVVAGRWHRQLAATHAGSARRACAAFNARAAGPSAVVTLLDDGSAQIVGHKLIWAAGGIDSIQLRSALHDAINQFKDLSAFLDAQFPDQWMEAK